MLDKMKDSFDFKVPVILVVEDDLTLFTFWKNLVATIDKKADVIWAENATTAESLIKNIYDNGGQIDLMILDIELNDDKDGVEIWKNHYQMLNKRIIFTSGLEYEVFLKKIDDSSYEPIYITKPINFDACSDQVYKMLHRQD